MNRSSLFAAQCLESSASAYAGYAASLLLERQPEIETRYAPAGLSVWKAHLTRQILELAAAMTAGEPGLFVACVRWEDRAARARDVENEDLVCGLHCLRQVFEQELPENALGEVASFLQPAFAALSEPEPADRSELDPSDPKQRLALQYMQAVLEGDARKGIDLMVAASDGGLSLQELYVDVLLVAQQQVGEMWHLGELGIAEEHFMTSTTERAMTILAHRSRPQIEIGKTVVAAAVAGNTHGLGVRALADFFELAGWRSICLGPDVPPAELADAVVYFDADLVALSATLATQLKAMRQSIEVVRSLPERPVKILVGGGALVRAPELWRSLGADGFAPRADKAVDLGGQLVGIGPDPS